MKKITIILIIIWTQTFSQIETIGDQISIEKLKKHITILASDSMGGREVGEAGETMAAD